MDSRTLVVASLMLAVVFLLPFGRLSELPLLLLAAGGLWLLISRFHAWRQQPWFKSFTAVFLLYFLLSACSAIDSYWPEKSWLIALGSWRFYLAGLLVIHCLEQKSLDWVAKWVTWLLVFWSLDALLQSALGHNILGQASYPGRLTGLFGQNVKLGPVLALFAPLLLIHVCRLPTVWRWALVGLVMLVVILSGTRSAWLMMAFVLGMFWWHHVRGRRWLLLLKSFSLMTVGVVVLWFASSDFQQRVDRSMQLLQGEQSAIDHALADRLSIWQTAWHMYQAHPINGVGARAFRQIYAEHAAAGDVWVAQQGGGLHAHHWVLEIMAETGTIGMVMMLMLLVLLFRHVRGTFNEDRVWPYGVALLAAFLPVVSLYSLFSSFWSICLWWMVMMLFAGVKNARA